MLVIAARCGSATGWKSRGIRTATAGKTTHKKRLPEWKRWFSSAFLKLYYSPVRAADDVYRRRVYPEHSTQNLGLPRPSFLNIGLLWSAGSAAWLNPLLRVAGGQVLAAVAFTSPGALDCFPSAAACRSLWRWRRGRSSGCLLRHHAHNIAHDMVVCIAAADYRAVWRKLPLQRRGRELPGRKAWSVAEFTPFHCRCAGDLLRRQLAQRGDLSARRLPAVGGQRRLLMKETSHG